MKRLISAYSCNPCKTSEPGNAWRIINEALREHEVWAVISHHHQEKTEQFLANNPMPGFHPIFVKLPPILVGTLRGRSVLEAVFYHLWQENLARVVRELHQRIRFDLSHHVTFGRYWSPSGLRVLNILFIWGPVGAAETPPRSSLTKTRPNPCAGRSS